MKDTFGNDIKRLTIDLPTPIYEKLKALSKLKDGSLTTAIIDMINDAYDKSNTDNEPTTLAIEAIRGLLAEALRTKETEEKQRLLWRIAEVFEFEIPKDNDNK